MSLSVQKTIAAALLGACLVGGPAFAETITLKADLKAANEVPPNNSPASGEATATFNTETKALSWTITFKDLTGPAVWAQNKEEVRDVDHGETETRREQDKSIEDAGGKSDKL